MPRENADCFANNYAQFKKKKRLLCLRLRPLISPCRELEIVSPLPVCNLTGVGRGGDVMLEEEDACFTLRNLSMLSRAKLSRAVGAIRGSSLWLNRSMAPAQEM